MSVTEAAAVGPDVAQGLMHWIDRPGGKAALRRRTKGEPAERLVRLEVVADEARDDHEEAISNVGGCDRTSLRMVDPVAVDFEELEFGERELVVRSVHQPFVEGALEVLGFNPV